MSRSITAAERRHLIRLAATLPKGSPERRTVLRMAASKFEQAQKVGSLGPGLVPEYDVRRSLVSILKRLKVSPRFHQRILNKKWEATNKNPERLLPNYDGFEEEILPLINEGRAEDGLPPAPARSWKSASDKWWNVLTKAQYKHVTKWYEEQRRNSFPDPYDPYGSGFWD